MANTAQSLKRARQAEQRRKRNQGVGTRFRTMVKRARANENSDNAQEALATMQSATDTAARKGIIHPRKAARLKRRVNAQMRKLVAGAQPAAAETPETAEAAEVAEAVETTETAEAAEAAEITETTEATEQPAAGRE